MRRNNITTRPFPEIRFQSQTERRIFALNPKGSQGWRMRISLCFFPQGLAIFAIDDQIQNSFGNIKIALSWRTGPIFRFPIRKNSQPFIFQPNNAFDSWPVSTLRDDAFQFTNVFCLSSRRASTSIAAPARHSKLRIIRHTIRYFTQVQELTICIAPQLSSGSQPYGPPTRQESQTDDADCGYCNIM
jgi:hypothetical protein